MKKRSIIAVLLAMIMVLSLCACGGGSSSSSYEEDFTTQDGLFSAELLASDEWCQISDDGVTDCKFEFVIKNATDGDSSGIGTMYFGEETGDSFDWTFDGEILSMQFGDGSGGDRLVEKTSDGYYRMLSYPVASGAVFVRSIDVEKAEEAEMNYVMNSRVSPEDLNPAYEPAIGMSKDEILNSTWGEPDDKNIDEYEWGTEEQWVYENRGYIYFENGIVDAIQHRD